jgi:hypothetical protein
LIIFPNIPSDSLFFHQKKHVSGRKRKRKNLFENINISENNIIGVELGQGTKVF